MRKIFLFLLLCQCSWADGQLISFERTSAETIYGTHTDTIYHCYSELFNSSVDSVDVLYTRIIDEADNGIVSALCTDIECYFVSTDSVVERIPSGVHKAEIRWQVIDEDLMIGEGYTEWKMTIVGSGEVIDTFSSKFVFENVLSATNTPTAEELAVYPIPAFNEILLPNGDFEHLQIFDINAKVILYQKSVDRAAIDISNWSNGMYFGKMKKEGRWYAFRFMKAG